MSEHTAISWCDHTFNPWWGCVKVSPACAHCYAETFSKRIGLKVWGADSERRFFSDKHWAEPLKWNRAAEQAGVRRRVFCASMADVFEVYGDDTIGVQLDSARWRLWDLITATPCLDWLLLTKRPENIRELYEPGWLTTPALNVWLGTTVENNDYRDRIRALLSVPAVHHFISYEPALGPLDLSDYLPIETIGGVELETWVDWVIAGAESGGYARPSHPDWFRSLRDQCRAAGVAFHFKQWGEWTPGENVSGDRTYPTKCWFDGRFVDCDDDWSTEADHGPLVYRVGKKAAGRLLDGREWNEFPEAR